MSDSKTTEVISSNKARNMQEVVHKTTVDGVTTAVTSHEKIDKSRPAAPRIRKRMEENEVKAALGYDPRTQYHKSESKKRGLI